MYKKKTMKTNLWINSKLACLFAAASYDGQTKQFKLDGKPIFQDAFTAAPEPLVVGDTLTVYVGHAEASGDQMFSIIEWLYYSTQDMKTWTAHGPIMKLTDFKCTVGDAWVK
jgi:arabinoxylan arabinofuranohydrolase